jgi:hypothetical protein
METETVISADVFELTGAAGSAVGALKALAEGNSTHLPPARLTEIAERLQGATLQLVKNSTSYS